MGTGVGTAVLDEAQQERVMFENAKFSLDAGDLDFQFLLESSQIFRFKKIRESSADRISNYNYDVGNIFLVKMLTRLSLYNLVTDRISIDKEANLLADFPEITIRQISAEDDDCRKKSMCIYLKSDGLRIITLRPSFPLASPVNLSPNTLSGETFGQDGLHHLLLSGYL